MKTETCKAGQINPLTTCTEAGILARSPRQTFWPLWLIVALGVLCFPRLGLCQTTISCGQTVSGTLATPSAISNYVYNGTAGQMLTIAFAWGGGNSGEVDIYDTNQVLVTNLVVGGTGKATWITLEESGPYTISVHGYQYAAANNYNLSVQSFIGGGCGSQSIVCGQTIASALTNGSQIAAYTYEGTAGQSLTMAFAWGGGDYGQADVYDPNGGWVTNLYTGGSGTAIWLTLAKSGAYTILVHGSTYYYANNYNLSVQSFIGGGCNGFTIPCGQTINGNIIIGSQMNTYELVASVGEHVILTDSETGGMVVDIYDPSGSNVVSLKSSTSSNYVFQKTGIYTLLVHAGNYDGTGSYSLTENIFLGSCVSLPVASITPTDFAVALGGVATFTAEGSGPTPLCYQWWFASNSIYGATNASYTITDVQSNELGNYQVVVSNPGGAATNTARLQGIPVITWTNPAPIVYDAALNSNQLNATTSVSGSFQYIPTNGTVLDAGTNVLSVIFTPMDTTNYVSVTNTVSLIVMQAPLTITASPQTKTYGASASLGTTAFTTSGLLNGDTVTGVTLTSSGAAATAIVVGSPYNIVPSAAVGTGLSNYVIAYNNGKLTVSQAPLMVTANPQTKTYGLAFSLGTTALTAGGLLNGDTVTGVTLTSPGAVAAATVAGSPYSIAPSAAVGTGLGNYTISYVNGALTVSKAALIVTASPQTKTYGVTFSLGTTAFTTSGLLNSDTVTGVTLASSGAATTATVASSPYNITPSAALGTGLANYSISYVNGALTVSQAPLMVTADPQTKTYGVTFSLGTTAFTISGLLNGDTVTGLTLTSPGAAAMATVADSPYNISPSTAVGTGLGNYSISYINGGLTVGQAALTVTATNETKTFGLTLTLAGTEFTTSGLVNGDTVTGVTLTSPGANATATIAGSPYPIIPSAAVGVGLPNYVISYVNGSLTVIPPAPIITWPNPTPITYGEALSTNQLDPTANVAGAFTFDPTNGTILNAGTNMLTAIFNPSDTAQYSSVTDMVSLVVSNALLTVVANNTNRTYGAANPAFTATFIGLTNENNASVIEGQPNFNTTATTSSAQGFYAIDISIGTLSASNYTFVTFSNGLLAVNPALLIVTAENATRQYGAPNPAFAWILTGFVNGDMSNVVAGEPGFTTTATATSSVGTYPIIPSAGSLSAANYDFTTFLDGALAIVQATPVLTWANPTPIVYGTALSANQLNATVNVPGANAYNPTNGTVLNAGTNMLTVVFTPADMLNYSNVTETVSLVVSPASLTVRANNTNRFVGQANPSFTDTITGLTNGDTITVTNSTVATVSSPAGPYLITPSLIDPNDRETNYTINLTPGTLMVLPLPETVNITYPTTNGGTYISSSNTVSVSGTVSDQITVLEVTWSETPAGGGTANGTTAWNIPSAPLSIGSNIVTVTAFDPDTASASITIIYTPITELPNFTNTAVIGGNLTLTLATVSTGSTVILQSSSDLKTWVPIQTNVVAGTSLPISYPINPALGETFLRAIVQ
jgi:hypothetical protein